MALTARFLSTHAIAKAIDVVPRSVAWPAAEANVAAMEAVDVATVTVRKAFSSYRTDGGHASAHQGWPAAHLLMLAVLTPLSVGAMFANGR